LSGRPAIARHRDNPQLGTRVSDYSLASDAWYPPYLLARQIAALKKLSDDTDTPVQHYIRKAVDEYLEKQKRKKKKPDP
jgi:hypothetical protein